MDTFAYKFLLFYLSFTIFIFIIITLAGPQLPSDILTPETKAKLDRLNTDIPNPSGITGFLAMGLREIDIFLTIMTANSPIRIFSLILLIFNIVALYILFPHIIGFFQIFTDLLGRLTAHPLIGIIVGVSIFAIVGMAILRLFAPETNPATYNECLECVKFGKSTWLYCNATLHTVVGCVPNEVAFPLYPGKKFPSYSNNTCVIYEHADRIDDCNTYAREVGIK